MKQGTPTTDRRVKQALSQSGLQVSTDFKGYVLLLTLNWQPLPVKFLESGEGEDDKDEHEEHLDGQLCGEMSWFNMKPEE